MGILQKIFGKEEQAAAEAAPAKECTHSSLVPRWDDPADMGYEDKVTAYTCSSCGESFSPDQKTELERADAERIREMQEQNEAHRRELEQQEAQEASAENKE